MNPSSRGRSRRDPLAVVDRIRERNTAEALDEDDAMAIAYQELKAIRSSDRHS